MRMNGRESGRRGGHGGGTGIDKCKWLMGGRMRMRMQRGNARGSASAS